MLTDFWITNDKWDLVDFTEVVQGGRKKKKIHLHLRSFYLETEK